MTAKSHCTFSAITSSVTYAAQELARSSKPFRRVHKIQMGVGHYGVFSGSKWNQQIYPRVREMIYANAA